MCTGMELLLGASLAAGTAGQLINQRQEQQNLARMSKARNDELRRTTIKNDKLADQSRDAFDQRKQQASAESMDADQAKAVDTRQSTMEAAIDSAPAAEPTLAGSAPAVIKSELAKRLADTISSGKDQAARTAKLGGFGDSWLSQGFKDVEAGRQIDQDANFQRGNLGILPHLQDVAEMRAYKPISPIGTLLQGLGAFGSSMAGAKAGVPAWQPKSGSWAAANAGYI